jgi:subtilisin family serine protease
MQSIQVSKFCVLYLRLEFENRAELSKSFLKDNKDCAGHGTQVASIIAGTNVGVAKAARIHALKILDCNGTGKNAHLIGAVYWIIKHHQKPAVINMSVGGIQSKAIDRAVEDAYNAGILVVTAAGNTNADACYVSPSGSPLSLNVGSVNKQDQKADFSNWGSCVDIMAPGVEIVCASPRRGNRKSRYGYSSGTSASAPMVTGIAAHFLEWNPNLSPDMLRTLIYENAAINTLNGSSLKGCVNRIAQVPKNIGTSANKKNIKFSKIKVGRGSSFFYSETTGDGCSSNPTWYWILIGLSIGFFVLAIVSSLVIWWRNRHPERRNIARSERAR